MNNTCFPFRFISRPSARSSQSHAISCSSLMSHHRVKNKSKRVKNSIENGSFMCFVIFYYIIICYVFSEASTPVLESFMNFTGKHLSWRLFFSLKWWNYIGHLFCMNKPYFNRYLLLIRWNPKRLKNTIDLLLFYKEHIYGL